MTSKFNTSPATAIRVPLYTLSLRNPGSSAVSLGNNTTYTFPIAPQYMRKDKVSVAQVMDIAGSSASQGVARQIDLYGEAPPIYTIRGTTGTKYHSMDGYLWDGVQSILRVQAIIDAYWENNARQVENSKGDQPYTLEFYDYYMDEYWQIVPVGPQGIEQKADQPLYAYYNFRFMAVKPVSAAVPSLIVDEVFNTLGANGLAGLALATGASGLFSSAVSQVNNAISSVKNFSLSTITSYLP